MKKVLYFPGFESLLELEESFYRSLEELEIPGSYSGTVKVTVEYENEGETENKPREWVELEK